MSKPNSEERHTAGQSDYDRFKAELDALALEPPTPTPWEVIPSIVGTSAIIHRGERIDDTIAQHVARPQDARRIVAAVNATAGISTASLESGVLGELVEATVALMEASFMGGSAAAERLRLDGILQRMKATP